MGYKLFIYKNKVESTIGGDEWNRVYEGSVDWVLWKTLVPSSFEVTNNVLSLGVGRYVVKMDFDELRQLKNYIYLLALMDDKYKIYHIGPLVGFRGRLLDDGWMVELFSKELLALFECVYSSNPFFYSSQNTLGKVYERIFLDRRLSWQDTGGWWDRGVDELRIHNPNQKLPIDYYQTAEGGTYLGDLKSGSEWVLWIAKLYPTHLFRFIPRFEKTKWLGFTFETFSSYWRLHPVLEVLFSRSRGRVVANNTVFENFRLDATQNYWNSVRAMTSPAGSHWGTGMVDLYIPSTPYYGYAPVGVDVGIQPEQRLYIKADGEMRVEKVFNFDVSKDSITDWDASVKGFLDYGLKNRFVFRADFIGHYDDIQLFQKIVFKYGDTEDEVFVAEKTLTSDGRVRVGFSNDEAEWLLREI